MDMRICKVLPHIEETLRLTCDVILTHMDTQSEGFHRVLRERLDGVCNSLHTLKASLPEEMITIPRKLIPQSVLNTYLTSRLAPQPSSVALCSSLAIPLFTSEHEYAATSLSSSRPLGTLLVPQTTGGWSVQPYDINITMVSDAWREWHVGLGNGKVKQDSIMVLEAKFGSSWWYEQKMRQWHSRRKKLISVID